MQVNGSTTGKNEVMDLQVYQAGNAFIIERQEGNQRSPANGMLFKETTAWVTYGIFKLFSRHFWETKMKWTSLNSIIFLTAWFVFSDVFHF